MDRELIRGTCVQIKTRYPSSRAALHAKEGELMSEKKKRPWIGFIGMLVLLVGLCAAFNNQETPTFGCVVSAVGGVVLVWALATGNVKTMG